MIVSACARRFVSRAISRAIRWFSATTALLRRQSLELAALALASPTAQVRGVQPFAAQHLANATRLGQSIRLAQNPPLVLGREPASFRFRRDLRINEFHGAIRAFRTISHACHPS
jgi:hypothetical protein